jgi:hypothetical protein
MPRALHSESNYYIQLYICLLILNEKNQQNYKYFRLKVNLSLLFRRKTHTYTHVYNIFVLFNQLFKSFFRIFKFQFLLVKLKFNV